MRRPSVEPTIYAIIAEGFASRLSFGIIAFALPLYARHLGLSLTAIGLLVSLNVIVAMALKPGMGWFADRYGLKRSYVAALVVRSLVSLLLAVAAQPWHLYALRSAHGVATALRDPASGALIAERSTKKIIASAFAWYGTAKSVAGALGHAVAGTLLTLTAGNYSAVFVASALLSVVALPVVVRFVPERRGNQSAPAAGDMAASPAADPHPDRRDAGDGLRPRLLPIMGLGFLISGTAKMIWGLFPVLAVEYAGLTAAEAGLISLVTAVVRLVAGPVFGWLSDNVSRNLVLSVRSVANVLSSVLYLSSPNFLGMLAGRVIDDAGKAAFTPAWGALMAGASDHDPRNRARTMGVLSLGEDAGDAAGPILAGFLWSTWGVGALFGVRIALAILTELYTIALARSGTVGDGRGQRAVVRAGTGHGCAAKNVPSPRRWPTRAGCSTKTVPPTSTSTSTARGPRPAAHGGGPPSPTRKSSEEELAALVDRSARVVWDVWVAGTREPTWDELPERVRERVRASAHAGLAAVGLSSPTELEDWPRERQGQAEGLMRAAGQETSPDQ